MNTQEYELHAMRTAKDMGTMQLNMIHAAMGLSGESGEFTDAIKKYAVYGKPLDVHNCVEELGDIMWFVALACKTLNITMSEVMYHNVQKLQLRYPDKYSDVAAISRADKSQETSNESASRN